MGRPVLRLVAMNLQWNCKQTENHFSSNLLYTALNPNGFTYTARLSHPPLSGPTGLLFASIKNALA
jgi:hypothetical protein